MQPRVVVIGAGAGGLACAIELASRGCDVEVLERAPTVGGKLREVRIGDACLDAGPTVFTMRWVFEELFQQAGLWLGDFITLRRAGTLARHAWKSGAHLDLYADLARTADAIGAFAGPAEGRRFLEFSQRARQIYQTLEGPFIKSACASPQELARNIVRLRGTRGLPDLWRISPFETLWRALGTHFHDGRLRQLFGRYATYCGSSPFQAPATLMLVAHVEQDGVWLVEGGMHRLAVALATVAGRCGARVRCNAEVARITTASGRPDGVTLADGTRIAADAVVVNADAAAVSSGLFGPEAARAVPAPQGAVRSLSAITWNVVGRAQGFPLQRHNVFFSTDYAAEFDDVFKRRCVPTEPTVYVCAQDRGADGAAPPAADERFLCLVNAPANGDATTYPPTEIASCQARAWDLMQRCGLQIDSAPKTMVATTPADFHRLFPATGGALYGPASHGWTASFNRPGGVTRMPGLFLAGGSVHPGPGVPMAAMSGRIAASAVLADLASMRPSFAMATRGGTSMR